MLAAALAWVGRYPPRTAVTAIVRRSGGSYVVDAWPAWAGSRRDCRAHRRRVVFLGFGPGKFIRHAAEVSSFMRYGIPFADAATYAVGALEIAAASR